MNHKFLYVLVVLFSCVMTTDVFAMAEDWTGNIDTDWNNDANFTGDPAGAAVIIDPANYIGAAASPVIAANSTNDPTALTVQGGGVLTIQADLTVGGTVLVTGASAVNMTGGTLTMGANDLNIESGAEFDITTAGIITGGGDLAITNAGSLFDMNAGTVTFATMSINNNAEAGVTSLDVSNGVFTITGVADYTKGTIASGQFSRFVVSGGTVTFTGDFNRAGNDVDFDVSGGTVIFEAKMEMGSAASTLDQTAASTIQFNNTDNWDNDGTFNATAGTVVLNGSTTLIGSGSWQFYNMTLNAGKTLVQTGPANINISHNWRNSGGTYTDNSNSVTINGTVDQRVTTAGAAGAFYDIIFNNTGSSGNDDILLQDDLDVDNNLTITDGVLTSNGNDITVGVNWINNGPTDEFSEGTDNVTFDSGVAQEIQGTVNTTFYDLTVGKSASDLRLQSDPTVTNSLNFNSTSGGLITTTDYYITITSAGSITGYDSDEFVATENASSGLIQQGIGSGSRTGGIVFPVGFTSAQYAPVTIDNSTGTADAFTVFTCRNVYMDGAICTGAGQLTTDVVNATWQITEGTPGGSDVTLTFQWNGTAETAGFDRTNCAISKNTDPGEYDWTDQQATGPAAGANPYTRSIASVTSFSKWAIQDGDDVLPIELLYFEADLNNKLVNLQWSTAIEVNNDFFTIEKSMDGQNFKEVATIAGAGNSTEGLDYFHQDADPYIGISYYRLRQTDFDGTVTFSGLQTVNYDPGKLLAMQVFPNPNEGASFNIALSGFDEEALVVVYDLVGNEVFSKLMINTSTTSQYHIIAMDPGKKLMKGVYLVVASDNQSLVEKRLVVY